MSVNGSEDDDMSAGELADNYVRYLWYQKCVHADGSEDDHMSTGGSEDDDMSAGELADNYMKVSVGTKSVYVQMDQKMTTRVLVGLKVVI